MEVFVRRPSVDLFHGVRVTKDTALEYNTEHVKQSVKDLVFRNEFHAKGEGFDGLYVTNIYLSEGDILVFEGEERGYVKPVEAFCSVDDALDDLTNIKEMG